MEVFERSIKSLGFTLLVRLNGPSLFTEHCWQSTPIAVHSFNFSHSAVRVLEVVSRVKGQRPWVVLSVTFVLGKSGLHDLAHEIVQLTYGRLACLCFFYFCLFDLNLTTQSRINCFKLEIPKACVIVVIEISRKQENVYLWVSLQFHFLIIVNAKTIKGKGLMKVGEYREQSPYTSTNSYYII